MGLRAGDRAQASAPNRLWKSLKRAFLPSSEQPQSFTRNTIPREMLFFRIPIRRNQIDHKTIESY